MSFPFSDTYSKTFLDSINKKPLWRDRLIQSQDNISNSICIQPFRTLSSYNIWINRNIVLSSNDEFIYISGSNVIIQNFTTKVQEIIPLKPNCHISSLFYQISSTNERLILIGEKYIRNKPIKDTSTSNEKKIHSGQIEIINLDNKILPARMSIDLGVYEQYDALIYDCVIPLKCDFCFIIVQDHYRLENNSKIFVWNIANREIVDIQTVPYLINGISVCSFNPNVILIYADNYTAIWNYDAVRKILSVEYEFYNNGEGESKVKEDKDENIIVSSNGKSDDEDEIDNDNEDYKEKAREKPIDKNCESNITKAEFVSYDGFNGICIAFTNGWFEIYEIVLNEEKQVNDYYLYLRLYLFDLYDNNWVNIEVSTTKEECKPQYLDNFIQPSTNVFMPSFGIEKDTIKEKDNFIKHIISRDKYILLFLAESNIVITFELNENEDNNIKVKLSSIDKIEQSATKLSSIAIDDKMTKMIYINGEEAYPFLKTKSRVNKAINELSSDKQYKCFYKCNRYKINFVDGIPNFVNEEELLKYTDFIYEAKQLLLSETPKILLINSGKGGKDLLFYKQTPFYNEETFNKQKITEVGVSNFIHFHTQYYKSNTQFEFFLKKTLEEVPIDIALSPLGSSFFIAFKESGYLYNLLGQEIKEVFKVGMYCRACAFNETGTYLAFSTSEYEIEYNIQIYNMSTYEYEYIITGVPPPTKLCFVDNGRVLIAQFKDTVVNLIGWHLGWKERLIKSIMSENKQNSDREINEGKSNNIVFKISDFSGNVNDFVYDTILHFCLITSADKRVRVYKFKGEEKHWDFTSDVEYLICILVKKYDTIIFATSKGTLRSCFWPIPNMLKDSNIDHPEYNEAFFHNSKITSLALSRDNTFLFSSAEDGSIFISCISAIGNDNPITISSFIYFNPNNVVPKKMYYDYKDIIYVTDAIYQGKVEALIKQKNAIQSKISEHLTNKDKRLQENANTLARMRDDLTKKLTEQVQAVKDQESLKEKETKNLKEKRETTIRRIKEKINEEKKKHKEEKNEKQMETTKLINCIKIAKEKFNQKKIEIETMRNKTNASIVNSYETMFKLYQDKKEEIDKLIRERKEKFEKKIKESEEGNETKLREMEREYKTSVETFEASKREKETEIMKKNKDNKNYNEKIAEWENHLDELDRNNKELMETYIFNTLKLNQMNQLLSENENKISIKEKIVKEKRLVNDRLEQLRFVLEYQIKNLILEKTPIEEQIKNFETLHSDFYKRFNLLYAELLNISDLIENNQKCIKTYRDELSSTKNKLYELKNLYKSIDVEMNSILKNKLDSKKDIINKITRVYAIYLKNFSDGKSQQKTLSAEVKLQNKNIEKEIYHQKNNVLRELVDKRSERRKINKEKEQIMKDIRLDNQLLIQECSNIRENLEDIMKNINDIEKKFNELKQSCENE